MTERFLARSKFREGSFEGTWDDVCDLDKRQWDVSLIEERRVDEPPEPLCHIEVIPRYVSGDDVVDAVLRPVFTLHDLVGIHI